MGLGKTQTIAIGIVAIFALSAGMIAEQRMSSSLVGGHNSASTSSSQVLAVFESHIQNIEARNVTVVMSSYEKNASLTWEGDAGGLGGDYEGSRNITALYGSLLPHFANLTMANMTAVAAVNGSEATVSSSFHLTGFIPAVFSGCQPIGVFNGTVKAEVNFVKAGGTWMISAETWDFAYPFSSGICT
jgi:hypothetical protein